MSAGRAGAKSFQRPGRPSASFCDLTRHGIRKSPRSDDDDDNDAVAVGAPRSRMTHDRLESECLVDVHFVHHVSHPRRILP